MGFRGKEDGFKCVFRGLGGSEEVLRSFKGVLKGFLSNFKGFLKRL